MTAPSLDEAIALPPMLCPARTLYGPNRTVDGHYFTAAQMREYATLAVAALRAQSGSHPPDERTLRTLASAIRKVAPHLVDEIITCATLALNQEQHDDNEGNGRRARRLAGEGHAGDAGSGGSANDIDGNNGAAQRDAGLLRSLAHGDSRQGNAAELTTDKPAALTRAQSGDALVPGGAMKARLFDLLVAKGRIKLCCDQLHRGNLGTRCAWIEFPLSDAMDISVEAYDHATQGAGK